MSDIVEMLRNPNPIAHSNLLRAEAADEIERLRALLEKTERQRDTLMDLAETVAQGRRGDCTCWVCELARQAQDAIDAALGEWP